VAGAVIAARHHPVSSSAGRSQVTGVRTEEHIRADIVEVGRRLWERGFVASNDGNISVRIDDRRLITTPKSVSKGFMTPDMMVVTDLDGRKLAGERDPSSELKMHLQVYRDRPDARAVVHAHPPTATGFAVAGIPLDRAVLAEVVTTLGSIPIAEYATPSTDELPQACSKYLKAHDGLLLANHGALAIGPDLFTAYYRMETIEHFAKISLVTRTLGREHLLSRSEVERLQGLRGMYGIASPAPVCTDDTAVVSAEGQVACQVVQAPESRGNVRLVADTFEAPAPASSAPGAAAMGGSQEIRLTYRELMALIEDAVRNLR
jgi:L-fuculose-phosphate aldolase